jgi:two-component system, NtrC family, sensor histidine kinase HydH
MWKRLITPTVLVSLLWLSVGAATIYYVNWVYRSHTRDLAENLTTIRATDAMQDALWRMQATVIEVAEHADRHTQIEVADLESKFEGYLAGADVSATTADAKQLIAEIGKQFHEYRRDIDRRLAANSAEDRAAVPLLGLSRMARSIADSCNDVQKIEEHLVADSIAQRDRLRTAVGWLMLVLWVVGPAVGIAWGIWVARWFRHSISRISISLKDAAGGLEREVDRFDLLPSDDLPVLGEQVQRVAAQIKKVVDDLQQARRETMLADRLAAVGEMAAGVAHELRNPLTSVKLLMQTAANGHAGRTLSKEHIHVIVEQVARMENIIQGLLDFARPPQMKQLRHDLRETLQRALNLVEGYAKQQAVEVRWDRPSEPVIVDGDPEQLHQVFVNLAMNGVEAMPDGGVLWIAMESFDSAAPIGRVQFRDRGCGIPDSIMQRIFEPFVTDKERGTGLGLAVSRRIVQQHGGKLTAENAPDRGAVFTVELPIGKPNQCQLCS